MNTLKGNKRERESTGERDTQRDRGRGRESTRDTMRERESTGAEKWR